MHQCVHCGRIIEDASNELLAGCVNCSSHFFFFIKKEHLDKLTENNVELSGMDKAQVEKDVREIIGVKEEEPVILDLESVKVVRPGKFIIDIVNLFRKDKPLIYKLEEGKYIIDLAGTLQKFTPDKK